MNNLTDVKPSAIALIPFGVFVFSFLIFGIITNDFYAIPSPIAVVLGIVSAVFLFKDNLDQKLQTFVSGCGDSKIITMCLIYLLAGAFATVTAKIGGVDAIVSLGLQYLDLRFLPLGIFIIASFLSTASGTSVGSIVALGPIVMGFSGVDPELLPLLAGALLGGSMFGDNLSMISDTTIAATQSLGCNLKDKFRVNLYIALPAAILTALLLFLYGYMSESIPTTVASTVLTYWSVVPYIVVLILATLGLNVFVTLFLGVILSGVIGLINNDFTWIVYLKEVYVGFTNMTEIFILSLLTGGLAAMVTKAGGIAFLVQVVKKRIKNSTSAQMGIGLLTGSVNAAIANNTVSIVIAGPIVKEITDEYTLDNRKSATIMDIFSCIVQGLLPYGAQVLFILSYAKGGLTYPDLFLNSFYLFILLIFTIIAIYNRKIDAFILHRINQ